MPGFVLLLSSSDGSIVNSYLTFGSPSTSSLLLGSLDSKFKDSVERVKESRSGESDDEDALFMELEAELENAETEAVRDRGLREMKAQ
jgi:hypothetical protein